MNLIRDPERSKLGKELHRVEVELGVGRRAVRALLHTHPVDEAAVAVARATVDGARQHRNTLRAQLETVKTEKGLRSYQPTWQR